MTNPPAGARQRDRAADRTGPRRRHRLGFRRRSPVLGRDRHRRRLAPGVRPRHRGDPATGRRPRSDAVGSVKGLAKLAPGAGQRRPRRARGARARLPGEVLLEVRAAGICGTDLHIEADEFREPAAGHDGARGLRRRRRGRRGSRRRPGSAPGSSPRRTSRPAAPASGAATAGSTSAPSGARSARSSTARSPAQVRRAGEEPPPRSRTGSTTHAAALSEPLACVCHCLLDPPKVAAGDRVLVTGPGPIGLLAAQVARALRRRRARGRLAAGRRRGSKPPRAARLRDGARGRAWRRFDVVVECSGAAGGRRDMPRGGRPRRRYVQVGVFGKPVTVPLDHVFQKELVVTSGFASTPRSWRRAMTLIETSERSSSSRSSPRSFRSTTWERAFADLRAGKAHQDRVRSATRVTGRGNRVGSTRSTDQREVPA